MRRCVEKVLASMGPRLVDRGEVPAAILPQTPTTASMGPRLVDRGEPHIVAIRPHVPQLQWGRGWLTAERSASGVSWMFPKALQWGRGWLTAESDKLQSILTGTRNASMGPRLVDRGEDCHLYPSRSTNVLLQWGRGWLTAESTPLSKPPRSFNPLQWGRGWLTAESRGCVCIRCRTSGFNGAAVG